MSENEGDRLKRNLEEGLAGAIATQELLPHWREAGDMPLGSESNLENAELSLFVDEGGVKAFKVRFRSLSNSFDLLTRYPVDLDEADQTLTDAIEAWWPKYRCCLVDYWNECYPQKPIDHPEDWGCDDNQSKA